MEAHVPRLILDLATVLGVAALITLVFRRLKQPAVLGYMLAGLIVGPHVPIPLVADLENVQTLAELGVVLLMFSVGLEFDFRKLLDKGPTSMVLGAIQLGCTTWLGFIKRMDCAPSITTTRPGFSTLHRGVEPNSFHISTGWKPNSVPMVSKLSPRGVRICAMMWTLRTSLSAPMDCASRATSP